MSIGGTCLSATALIGRTRTSVKYCYRMVHITYCNYIVPFPNNLETYRLCVFLSCFFYNVKRFRFLTILYFTLAFIYFISVLFYFCLASRGSGVIACGCKREMLWVRFPLEEMKYLFFLFLRSGVETKRGFKFRHWTRNAFRIRRVGSGVSWH